MAECVTFFKDGSIMLWDTQKLILNNPVIWIPSTNEYQYFTAGIYDKKVGKDIFVYKYFYLEQPSEDMIEDAISKLNPQPLRIKPDQSN